MIQKFYKIKDKLIKACEKDPYFRVHMRILMNNCYNRHSIHYTEFYDCCLDEYVESEGVKQSIVDNMERTGLITRLYKYYLWPIKNGVYKVNVGCAEVQYFELMVKENFNKTVM